MADPVKRTAPPYAAFSSFINFINKLRDTVVPDRIDPSVFGNASGSISYSIIATLKALKMIDADGVPQPDFIAFVNAQDESRKPMMAEALKRCLPTLWNGTIKLETATAGQFDEHIRNEYDVKGSTIDKVAAFFIAAASFAEIPISAHLKARKATAASPTSRKSAKQRARSDVQEMPDPFPSPVVATPSYHPFVQGLLDTLPAAEKFEEWTIEQQAEWLEAAAGIFKLLSKQKGRISVSVQSVS